MRTALVRVTGKVQGVFFRACTQQVAESLGLTGYAKNLSDGSVELVLSGGARSVERLLCWLKAEGPPLAHIKDLRISELALRHFDEFCVC